MPKVASSKAVILVVDDEPSGAEALSVLLQDAGYDTVLAGSGAEALVRAAQTPPDLVLLDVRMPGISGIEVARRLSATHPELVVVLISIEERIDVPSAAQLEAVPLVRKQEFGPRLLRRLWDEYGH